MGTLEAVASIKRLARRGAAELYARSAGFPRKLRGKVAILQYHRIVTPDDLNRGYIEPGMYVLNDVFDMQVRWLLQQFEILSLSQLLARWNANEWDERKAYCVLTFDDGWLDNYRHAFPVLKKYGVPATIFLPTNYIGSNEWFWPEKISFLLMSLDHPRVTLTQRKRVHDVIAELPGPARFRFAGQEGISGGTIGTIIEQSKMLAPGEIELLLNTLSEVLGVYIPHERVTMNWSEVTEMAENGISFGSHSCSHRLLTQVDRETIRQELQESNRVLRGLPVGYVPVFCYPNGNNNDAIQDLVKESQYAGAVGTRRGTEGRRPENIYELRRIGMHNDVTGSVPLLTFHLFRAVMGF